MASFPPENLDKLPSDTVSRTRGPGPQAPRVKAELYIQEFATLSPTVDLCRECTDDPEYMRRYRRCLELLDLIAMYSEEAKYSQGLDWVKRKRDAISNCIHAQGPCADHESARAQRSYAGGDTGAGNADRTLNRLTTQCRKGSVLLVELRKACLGRDVEAGTAE